MSYTKASCVRHRGRDSTYCRKSLLEKAVPCCYVITQHSYYFICATSPEEARQKFIEELTAGSDCGLLVRPQFRSIGEYKGISLLETALRNAYSDDSDKTRVALAKAYIDLAQHLEPDLKSGVIDIEYCWNNLHYLQQEIDETGSLYRVFVPIDSDHHISSYAQEVAAYRGFLTYDGEDEAGNLSEEGKALLQKVLKFAEGE